ncbi:hypothetical protein AB0F46_29625 [Streptomyces sp. NPDC026665]|uniref:hypothetical protein n=1 Tax=Streptomyces sp. NPDC026665 TaxID=3154798 RepID=UPI003402DAAD
MELPYVYVGGIDTTDTEKRASVELRFGGEASLIGLTEQDIVDAVKAVFAGQPNVSVTALRYSVGSTAV